MDDEKLLHRTMVAVVFGALMSMLDTTIVNVAIRSLSVRLHTPLPSVQWVVTGYLLALAATLPLTGWLAGKFGARRVYVWSIAVFTLASAACGLAGSAGMLIAFRVVQGMAGAVTMPAGQMIMVRAVIPVGDGPQVIRELGDRRLAVAEIVGGLGASAACVLIGGAPCGRSGERAAQRPAEGLTCGGLGRADHGELPSCRGS